MPHKTHHPPIRRVPSSTLFRYARYKKKAHKLPNNEKTNLELVLIGVIPSGSGVRIEAKHPTIIINKHKKRIASTEYSLTAVFSSSLANALRKKDAIGILKTIASRKIKPHMISPDKYKKIFK